MPAPNPDNERSANAQLVVELIEADPFTSAGLVGTPSFGVAETAAGASHEAFIEAYLDDLIRTLPGMTLTAAARDRILDRISAGLRRAFLTVGADAAGTLDVRGITNPKIVGKYRRVIELLSAAMSGAAGATQPHHRLASGVCSAARSGAGRDAAAAGEPQHRSGRFQPRAGQRAALRSPWSAPGREHGLSRRLDRPTAERFVAGRAPCTAWRQHRRGALRPDLRRQFECARRVPRRGRTAGGGPGVRPAHGRRQEGAADRGFRARGRGRPAGSRSETSGGLDAGRARPGEGGIRPDSGERPSRSAASRSCGTIKGRRGDRRTGPAGFTHTSASPVHDVPGPPAHGPPHIHYYDVAFAQNAVASVGPPGRTGPGGDWTIAHEVGHMRIFLCDQDRRARP